MKTPSAIKYTTPVLLIALMALVVPQDNLPEQLKGNLDKWRTHYAQEKIYLQHDIPYYTPGQEVWLKGYVLHAADLKPSNKSRVLYADLLDANNQPVHQLKLKVNNGTTEGEFVLPDDLPEGIYILRGYTQWMRNFGEENFFTKSIRVISQSSREQTAPAADKIDLQFFPEGGDWITGVKSKIAFKAVAPDGRGTRVGGAIFDDQGKKILDFEDTHLGMGAFTLQPQEGRSYFAKVNFKDGTTTDFPLPESLREGYTLAVDENFGSDVLLVTVTGHSSKRESLVLTGTGRDALQYSKTIKLKKGQRHTEEIPKSTFSTGIVRFNLAFADGEPLAERLVFINHKDALNLKISTSKARYASREQVTLQIEAHDAKGKPVAAAFSLAVTDDELAKHESSGLTLPTYLLLTSDLRGNVEQPGYYFENDDAKTAEALSHLMMTHGWRRFTWKDAAQGKFPEIKYRNENSLAVRGRLVNQKGDAVPNGEVILYLKDQHHSFIVAETNNRGEFDFEGFDFTDSLDIVVQGADAKGRRKNVQVKMDDEKFFPTHGASPLPPPSDLMAGTRNDFVVMSQRQSAAVEKEISTYTLKDVMLEEVIIEGRAEIITPFRLHREADVVLRQNDLFIAPSGNILESLQGRVAGLQVVRTGPNQFSASIRGQGPPLYLLDGMPIEENTLNMINQFDISHIEILKNVAGAAIYGGRASNGVIALYTRRGGEDVVEVKPGPFIIIHRLGGFSKAREFYSPQYPVTTSREEIPDLRTTIYWNPRVQTNSDGVAKVTFFTADRSTTYRAIVEGISNEGTPGRKEITFSVKGKESRAY